MTETFATSLLPSIEHFHLLGYWVAFFAALLETTLVIGLLLPGSTVLLLLGALSANGHLDFGTLLWFAIAGAALGDNLNYWLGLRYGSQWTRNGAPFLTRDHFEQTSRFFERHGAKSVFLGRFIPGVKEIAPFVAGTVGMRRRTFMLWNVLGAVGWGLQWVGGGYLFGQSLNLAQAWMSRAGLVLIAMLFVCVLLWLLQRFVVREGYAILRLAVSLGRSIKMALGRNPHMRRLVRRHPAAIRFLAQRFDRSSFHGLPLTVLMLAFVYVLALFAGTVEDVVTSDPIVALDHAAAQLIAAFRTPLVVASCLWITTLGEPPVVGAVLVMASLMALLTKRKYVIAGLLASSLGAASFSMLGKLTFQRPRPIEAVLLESSYSFPSGHATIAVAFYGFLGYLLIRSATRWKNRANVFFATATLILLIGLSRIVLGVHYLSDVWAGFLVGALWLIVGISLTEWLSASGRIVWRAPVDHRRSAAAIGLVAGAAIGLIGYASSRTLPVMATPPETITRINRPFEDTLLANRLSTTATVLGEPEQPLTFAIAAPSADALSSRLVQAGWMPADRPTPENLLRLARQGMNYATAPLAPAFWNNRMNDLAFERPRQRAQGKTIVTLRVWHTSYRLGADQVFVGVTREYDSMRWGILHTLLPDVDAAAEYLVESVRSSSQSADICQRPFVPPMIGAYQMGARFFTRGHLWLINSGASTDAAQLCARSRTQQ